HISCSWDWPTQWLAPGWPSGAMADAETVVAPADATMRPARSSLGRQSLAMSGGLLLSGGFSFLSDVVIADRFGASTATDAFLVASQIPGVAESLLSGPAMHNALMPVAASALASPTSSSLANGLTEARLRRLVWNITTLVLAITTGVGLLAAIAATWVVPLFA